MNQELLETAMLISGRSNMPLAADISKKLQIPLVKLVLSDFSNTEIRCEIQESVREKNVYIIQTGAQDTRHSINDYIFELFSLVNACKLSGAKSISAIIPYFPYSRSDKKDAPRVPINSALFANLLKTCGIDRVVSMDLHSGQIQGYLFDVPFDNLYAIDLNIKKMREIFFHNMTPEQINDNYILVSPDNGGIKRIEAYASILKMTFGIMHKQRDYTKSSCVLNSMYIGDTALLKNKIVFLVDDMADTLGTMVSSANELAKYDIVGVVIVVTHGILSGPAIEKLNSSPIIKNIVVTNSIDQTENLKNSNKIIMVDTSDLFAEVIRRLQLGGSISQLFPLH